MIYNVYLVRHAKTQGNFEGRYIGAADEPLCSKGIRELEEKVKAHYYPQADRVYTSPMQRCRETAQLIYPKLPLTVVPGFAEYNFGEFEGKTYQDLKEDVNYRNWIDSRGAGKTPGGEDIQSFKNRCCRAFEEVIAEIIRENYQNTVLVVHGGTIMAVLEKYMPSDRGFYGWQTKSCEGYKLALLDTLWKKDKIIKFYKDMNSID